MVVAVAAALALAGCGSSGGGGGGGGGTPTAADCGLGAFAQAKKPVEVTFWHAMSRANVDWLTKTTAGSTVRSPTCT